MLILYLLVPLNLLLIWLYFRARTRNDLPRVAILQPSAVITSWLIAAASLLKPDHDRPFTVLILAGMALAIVGDFLNLDMENPSVVMRGLVIAVIAYLTYAVGLTILNGFHLPDLLVAAILLGVYLLLMRTIWHGLGEMRIPVMIYGLVLPFTFSRAVSTFFGTHFSFWQAFMLSAGSLSLFAGDIEFAIHTFKRRLPLMYGPILYAGGQLLLALSLWMP